MFDINDDVTAYMNGNPTLNPNAFAAGVKNFGQQGVETAKAVVRHDGSSKFTDTEVTGVINALSGAIGGLTIEGGKLYVGNVGGDRIELDPYNRRIRLINNADQLMGQITFATGDTQYDIGAIIEMNHFYQGVKRSSVRLGGVMADVTMRSYNTSGAKIGETNYRYDGVYKNGVKIL